MTHFETFDCVFSVWSVGISIRKLRIGLLCLFKKNKLPTNVECFATKSYEKPLLQLRPHKNCCDSSRVFHLYEYR